MPSAFFAFLHLPLLTLAVFSFNSSRFTVWEHFSLDWYRAIFRDPELVEATWNSVIVARGSDRDLDRHRDHVRLRSVEEELTPAYRHALSFAGHAGNRNRHFAAGLLPMDVPLAALAPRAVHRDPGARGVFHRLRGHRDLRAPAHDQTLRWKKPRWISALTSGRAFFYVIAARARARHHRGSSACASQFRSTTTSSPAWWPASIRKPFPW